ncbi:ABC transporter permease subunit [Vibrio astriarenae]
MSQVLAVEQSKRLKLTLSKKVLGWLALLPLLTFLAMFFVLPVAELLSTAFGDSDFSLQHFYRLFSVPVYTGIITNTFYISIMVTVLCVLISYPVAYAMATVSSNLRKILLVMVLLPFWTSSLVRTTAWIVLLQKNGVLNSLLMELNMITEPIAFVYNLSGVLIGMTHVLMPFIVLPLYASFRSLDTSILRAAESLGASSLTIFRRIILPLTAPGVIAGSLIVFMNSVGYYITPALMGGVKQTMIAQLIADNITKELNWEFAAAISVMLLLIVLSLFFVFQHYFGLEKLMTGSGSKTEESYRKGYRRTLGGKFSLLMCLPIGLFLIAPIIVVFPMSLGSSPFLTFPPQDLGFQWYENFFSNAKWIKALMQSLKVAGLTVVFSTVLGTLAAIGIFRIQASYRKVIEAMFIMPMIVPVIILSIGLYYLLVPYGLVSSIWGLVIGHTVIATPYVFMTVRASLVTFDSSLELAARSLGAPWIVFFYRVLFPSIFPGVIGGAVFAFITSFDDLIIALFMTNVRSRTLPKLMYEGVAHEIDPTIIAASGIIILFTIVMLLTNLIVTKRK